MPTSSHHVICSALITSIRSAAVYNPEVQVSPACILWPDRDRQWEAIIPRLQSQMEELFVLGDYAPEQQSGPAIWLRCVMAGTIEGISPVTGSIPIFYLPGVSRQDLRAVESCPDHLKPLAELQYRGVIWSQINGKDWTALAFLKSDQGGLGLDVGQDTGTKKALLQALPLLLDLDLVPLTGKRLDEDFFNGLLTGGDPIRDLLLWLDQGDGFRQVRSVGEWQAFVRLCKSQFAFDPENHGQLSGAAKLANQQGPWNHIWQRFSEAPQRYPHIPDLIRKCDLPTFDLFTTAEDAGGWPQWNDIQESSLHADLMALEHQPPEIARAKITEFEAHHGVRRNLVWAELGESVLACALEHLAVLAETTRHHLAAGSLADLVAGYRLRGWRADDAVLRALACVDDSKYFTAVVAAIRALYTSWADESARYLQSIWQQEVPKAPYGANNGPVPECILFVDGLRYDCAMRLTDLLESAGITVTATEKWSALPSVTGTCKPAIAPLVRESSIAEEPDLYNFEPLTAYQFKKALEQNGWTILNKKSPSPDLASIEGQRLWVECGDLDHEGHDRGWKLARHLVELLLEVKQRVIDLVERGWQNIRIITDHGWLLLPGGLPKVELPSSVTESKWARCAVIKPGASCGKMEYPWHWNTNLSVALAGGIGCFRKNEEYSHGGISLQECMTLELAISGGDACKFGAQVAVTDLVWKGLRCTIAVDGDSSGLFLDIREQAGNAQTSVVVATKLLKTNGTASVVVDDEEKEGRAAIAVLVDDQGALVAQIATVIGGGDA